jgi:ribosomal protein S18 acetylase RimI-like enzyme
MQNQSINIRPAILHDINALEGLNREVQEFHVRNYPHIFKETSSDEVKDWFRQQFKAGEIHIFVACREIDIVGYLMLRLIRWPVNPFTHPREFAYIDQIGVTESCRGQGIGRKLMDHAIDFANTLGFDCIELDVWSKNTRAKIAFEKMGFSSQRELRALYINV